MKNPTSSIQVIDRLSLLLDAIAKYDEPVSLKFLSADTGLHPATVHRILSSLALHGFVEKSSSGNYALGYKLLELGSRMNTDIDIQAQSSEILQMLRDQVEETANLTIRKNDHVVYVERAVTTKIMRVEQVIGSDAPLHVTAVGKLMLAEDGHEAIYDYINRTGLHSYTKNTLSDPDDFINELAVVKTQGYAFDNEEAEIGVGCIGAIVRNAKGEVVAGLSVSAPIERRKDEWVEYVVEAANKLSARLGYRASQKRGS